MVTGSGGIHGWMTACVARSHGLRPASARFGARRRHGYSHSIVAGGFDEMS